MAKTALELSPEGWRAYRPILKGKPAIKRWGQAWEVARAGGHLLHERFGATRVVVFGSLTDRAWFTQWSDIDMAAWGIPGDEFFRAVAMVTGLSSEFEVDLVDPETCRPSLRRRIEQEGIEL